MKKTKLIIAVLFILIGISSKALQSEVLSNESVVSMYSQKLPQSIILGKIKASKNNFDVSTKSLMSLSESKLPEDIINSMIEAANDNSRHVVVVDLSDPKNMHEPGIYYYNKKGEKPELVQLESAIYSQSKSSGGMMSAMTYGLSKIKVSLTLDGNAAQLQLTDNQPEFYFYFDVSGEPLTQTPNWWFSTAASPNEFQLIILSKNKKTREVTMGSANILGSSSGVDDKNKTAYKIEKISQGIYKVYFDKPLYGEYCFMFSGSIPTGYTNKVFDFGVVKN